MPEHLDEYVRRQRLLSDAAAASVLSVLRQWVTENDDPNMDVFTELATNTTLLHSTGATLASAKWVADWLSVVTGEAVPVPEVDVERDEGRLRDAYRKIVGDVDIDSRQYFTIRDRLVKAEGIDVDEAGRRAMNAIREQAEKRAGRLAANVCRDAGANGMSEAMDLTRRIEGWTRNTQGDNCDDCTSLADGTVLPPGARMVRHPGCDCTQQPVLKGHTT